MRLKEHFFDSDELIILESMDKGYIYSNILLKLYLKSLKRNGKLMLSDTIPYSVEILAKVIRHDTSTVQEALRIFEELGLIEVLENKTIYITNIQSYIGKSSTEADRKRQYREQIEKDKTKDNTEDKCPDKSTPEKETETELETDTDLKEEEIPFSYEIEQDIEKFTENSFEILCVNTIIQSCLELYPNSKVPSTYKEKEKWAIEIERMKRIDNRSEEEIKQALQFAINDTFWKLNIRSAKKFREKFETLLIQSRKGANGNKGNKGQQIQDDFINNMKGWLNDTTGIY
jgi:predicted phage replisome organizer